MRVVRIGICGWGNVATGMFKAIAENKTVIEAAGVNIDIDCIGARRDNPKCNPGSVKILRDIFCLLYTSPSPRDGLLSRMPSSA